MNFERKRRIFSKNSNSRDRSASSDRRIPNFDEQNFSKTQRNAKGSPVPYTIQQNRKPLEHLVRKEKELDFLDSSDTKHDRTAGTSTENHNEELDVDESDYSVPNGNVNVNFENDRNPGHTEGKRSHGKQETKTRFSIFSFLLGFLVGLSLMGFAFYSQQSCRDVTNENFALYWKRFKAHPEVQYWAECYTNFYNQNRLIDEETLEKTIEKTIEIDEKIEKIDKIIEIEKIRKETEPFLKISQLFEQFSVDFHLPEREKSSLKRVMKWVDDPTKDPTVYAVVGNKENVRDFIKKLMNSIDGDVQGKTLEVNENVDRVELHEFFEKTLTIDEAPRLAAVLGIEALKWDAPLSIHAWADDGQPMRTSPPSPHSLILLGVGVDGEEIEEYQRIFHENTFKCQAFLQKYLLKRWKAMGGSYSMITPIVNSRIDYSICLPL